MAVTTTEIFSFIDQHKAWEIERREVSSYYFSVLRQNLLFIIKRLYALDAYDAKEKSNTLRWRLSEWLTSPIIFDGSLLDTVRSIGDPDQIAKRWPDIKSAYDSSLIAATQLVNTENPVRQEIHRVIRDLIDHSKSFMIYCHKETKSDFESILQTFSTQLLESDHFICTPKSYRNVELFDVLLKVGPLCSSGWGKCPDALLTAPRFDQLVYFVWSGSRDEEGFGLDPVTGEAIIGENSQNLLINPKNGIMQGVSWKWNTQKTGDENCPSDNLPIVDEDEFQVFRNIDKADKKPASLIKLDEKYGILYPIKDHILSFDPFANSLEEQIGLRLLDEMQSDGIFIILPVLSPVDFGELHAKEGEFSPIWKKQLTEAIQADQAGLCMQLSERGLDLIHLYSRLEDWCKPPDTVIPAPRRAEHFKILINLLAIDFKDRIADRRLQWWQYAWMEIRHSRGEAISEGRYTQDLLHENILILLNLLREEIKGKWHFNNDFIVTIPAGKELQGYFRFCRVIDIEKGFLAPDLALGGINELKEFVQWQG